MKTGVTPGAFVVYYLGFQVDEYQMRKIFGRFIRYWIRVATHGIVGALLIIVIGLIVHLENRPDLNVWHEADLDEEFTRKSEVNSFAEYLELEDRLFAQLEALVYSQTPAEQRRQISRYHPGSLTDPSPWSPNWNRSFVLEADSPKAAVLLLHGMSDSPYSLRSLGKQINAAGALVMGLRLPGHGTAPSGLVTIHWKDMAAAVRLALKHLAQQVGDRPLYIVGYSNGAALAVHYALSSLADESLPEVEKLVLVSPAIGVTSAAALAIWQARLGHFLGLEKLAWNAILPEYDPYKYQSFAVNAGDVVYRLTEEIQRRLAELKETGRLGEFPPVLAFASIVDATVSNASLVNGLFHPLPEGGHELVLFDINRMTEIEPILRSDPAPLAKSWLGSDRLSFTISLATNASETSPQLVVHSKHPDREEMVRSDPGLTWPGEVYSLSHVALPIPPDDPLYGGRRVGEYPLVSLGEIALRGERGVLQIPASDMLRLRWNPFYSLVESRTLEFMGLTGESN